MHRRPRLALFSFAVVLSMTTPVIAAHPKCLPDCADADLSGANMRWANLRSADFTGADLSWADLSHADLSSAVLTGARLSWADLHDAIVSEHSLTDVLGCDLTGRIPNCGRVCPFEDDYGWECTADIARFVRAVKDDDRSTLEHFVEFPLWRPSAAAAYSASTRARYPIPPIERHEFFHRYDEMFDESLIATISESDPSDWIPHPYKGIRLKDGIVWLHDSGTINSLPLSEYEAAESVRLIQLRREKESRELHRSIREYESPILEWKTATYRIRVDDLGGNRYRYAAWNVDTSHNERPDLVLNNGEISFSYIEQCGSGGGVGEIYSFTNGEYLYDVDVGFCFITNEEEQVFNVLRVWRSRGRAATIPDYSRKDHGYELLLQETFEVTHNEIDLELYADYRSRSLLRIGTKPVSRGAP